MRYLHAHAIRGGDWDELAGPFPTLATAEAFVHAPPADLGDPGTVTIVRDERDGAWYVLSLASERRVA